MSGILKVFADRMTAGRPTSWLILDCGHWYHWTGDEEVKLDADFPCPDCKPPITIKESK